MFNIPYEWRIGMRYLRAKRRNHFISFISLISFLGIALGILALITILSIMNGFHEEIRHRMLSMTAHMTVTGTGDRLPDWEVLAAQLENSKVVLGMAPNISRLALVSSNNGDSNGAMIKGVLPEKEVDVSGIESKMVDGHLSDLQAGEFNIILGKDLANRLGLMIGDKVSVITPEGSNTAVGFVPKMKRFTLIGIFEVGMQEYDSGMAFIHLKDAQQLFSYGEQVSGLQLKVSDMFDIPAMREAIGEVITRTVYVTDWTQQHANFFAALQLEKRMMFIGLALIVMVAAFNIISTMVMVVTDKRSDIAILKTLGATPFSIMSVFIVQGMSIGIIGMLLGVAGGVAVASNIDVIVPFIEHVFGFKFFPANVFYISFVPSHLEWSDVWQVSFMAFLLTLMATLYPAWQAAHVQPAEALRYE